MNDLMGTFEKEISEKKKRSRKITIISILHKALFLRNDSNHIHLHRENF